VTSLRLRRPPAPALFRYTTLFRSTAGDELHDHPRVVLEVEDVVDGHDRGVRHARRGPRLAQHPGAGLGTLGVGQMAGEEDLLDGDVALELGVPGVPDDAHAAPSQLTVQPVAPG